MIFSRTRAKWFGALSLLGGMGAAGYYLVKNYTLEDENVEFIKEIQSNSTVIAMLNTYITKNYGTNLTSTIQGDIVNKFNPDSNAFTFTMSVRKADDNNGDHPDFAEILSTCSKKNDTWFIDSLDIKFKNSNSKSWLKLYEMLYFDSSAQKPTTVDLSELLASNFIKDSDEYLRTFAKQQPYIVDSLNILINDRQRINNLGAPIRLISHDLFENEPDLNVKMRIEGKKRTADLIFDVEKTQDSNQWNIDAIFLIKFMIINKKLQDDFILSTTDLAKKYADQALEKIKTTKDHEKLYKLLKKVNISKLFEERLVQDTRLMSNIGRPMHIEFYPSGNFKHLNKKHTKIKFKIVGKLNTADFILEFKPDAIDEVLQVQKCEVKINWDTSK